MNIYDINNIKLELKKIFIGYRTMKKTMRKKLKEIGLIVKEGSKHYKIVTLCEKYVCTISKTASDFRSGYNIAHNICYGLYNNI